MEMAEGEQIRCEVRVNVLDADETVQGTLGIVREIGGRKRAETEATEATFRRLFENVPGNYLIVQPEDYEIVAVSDAYLDATMTGRAEIMGKTLFEIFPNNPDDPAEGAGNLRKSLERVVETGKSDTMPVTHYPIPDRESDSDEFEERWWNPINSPDSWWSIENSNGARISPPSSRVLPSFRERSPIRIRKRLPFQPLLRSPSRLVSPRIRRTSVTKRS